MLAQQETGYNKNFWVLADDSIHPEVKSNHFVMGMTFEKGRFLFDAEVYYKSYSGLQEYIYLPEFLKNTDFNHYFPEQGEPVQPKYQPSFFVRGIGRSYGLDMMLKYKSNRYASWLSYSFGRSFHRYTDINNGEEIPAPTDRPHQLSWTNMVSAGKSEFWNCYPSILPVNHISISPGARTCNSP